MVEMDIMSTAGQDCWLSKVRCLQSLLGLTGSRSKQHNKNHIESIFDRHWLDQVNQVKTGTDGLDHNKLRTYKIIKGSIAPEPYIDCVRNRNQRKFLSRFRLSAHCLDIERLRYTNIPVSERTCRSCTNQSPAQPRPVDDEFHFFNYG